jgi:hypothetical protein
LGRGTILKEGGICVETWVRRIWFSSLSILSKLQESASATWLLLPGNHWLYSLMLADMNQDAWLCATLILIVAWSLLMSSLKFVFCVQPSEVVLSVMDSEQSPSRRQSARMSIQGEMTRARSSRRLFDAVNFTLLSR